MSHLIWIHTICRSLHLGIVTRAFLSNSKHGGDPSERLKKAPSIPCLGTSPTSGDNILTFLKYLTLKTPEKMHLKMLSAYVVCCMYCLTLLTHVSIEAFEQC